MLTNTVPTYLVPMLVTLVAWIALTIQFTGLGMLSLSLVARHLSRQDTLFTHFWLGTAATLGWLQVWSLFLPLSWEALLVPLAVGVVGWVIPPREAAWRVLKAIRRKRLLAWVIALAVWGALTAQGPLNVYDAGTYHLSALRWASTYPVVPGLGNLNAALGLDSSLFLYLASLSIGDVAGFHIGIGLLLVALLLELGFVTTRRLSSITGWLAVLMIMPSLVFIGNVGLSTTIYDAGGFVFAVAITWRLLRLLDLPALTGGEALVELFVIATLGYAAVTVKIANAAFGGACIGLVLALVVWRVWPNRQHVTAALAIVVSLAFVLIGPWLVRNAVMTGYLLYPVPTLSLPFDWTMPEAAVRAYRDTLSDFARVRGPGFEGASANFAWVGRWFSNAWRDVAVPVIVGVLTPMVLILSAPKQARCVGSKWLILVPLWIGVLAWFFSSPDPRYASALLWLVAAVPLAFCLVATRGLGRLALALAFVAGAEMPNAAYVLRLIEIPLAEVSSQLVDVPDIPNVALSVSTTNSGLRVYGPPPGSDQVWDAPLPASFWPIDPNLRLRCPDSLACGFTVR